MLGKKRERERSDEKRGREHSRDPGEEVGCSPARHEPAAAATHPERPALGALKQHDGDEGRRNHEMNNEKNSGHGPGAFAGDVGEKGRSNASPE